MGYISRKYTKLQNEILRLHFKRPEYTYDDIAATLWCSQSHVGATIQKFNTNDLVDRCTMDLSRLELNVNMESEINDN